jgi:myo-inositol 2-dehydrogenase / D-chiro-inositol 1-dehydrogenase
MATYTGQEITWEEALNSQETLAPSHLDWNTKPAVPALAVPGITKLA